MVVRNLHPVGENLFRCGINPVYFFPRVKGDAVFLVPWETVDLDLAHVLRTVQDIRKQNAVVVSVGFFPKHDYLKLVPVQSQDVFGQTGPRHAVSKDDESGSFGMRSVGPESHDSPFKQRRMGTGDGIPMGAYGRVGELSTHF